MMHQAVLDVLKAKRFALIGFDAGEAERIISAFRSAGAFARTADTSPVHPGLNSLAPFDAFVLNASAANGSAKPLEVIARAAKPAMIVGTPQEMMNQAQAVAALEHDFVVRPWTEEELLLRAYRALRHAASTAPPDQVRHSAEPRIMVVDDDRTTTTLLSMILRAARMHCEVAHSGREALSMASRSKPDLLLLDISMPEVDGFQVLAALRDDPVTRDLPVMLLTVSTDENDVLRGFSLGAEDYVTKPFNPRELLARVGRILHRSSARNRPMVPQVADQGVERAARRS